MIGNSLMQSLPNLPWEGDTPELAGVLVFDVCGALLGGGVIGGVEDEEQKMSMPAVVNRWKLSFTAEDWAVRFKQEQPQIIVEQVRETVVIMLQATMLELGNTWDANESKWIGRLEGAMGVLDRLGVKVNDKADIPAGEHVGESDFIAPRQ